MTSDGAEALVARLEAVPFSRWHLRPRLVIGSATFFDAFDTLALAFVLPVLVREWQLSAAEVGWLIAVGYLGQLAGALLFGTLAERFGRVRSAAAATALMSLVGIACALATNLPALMALRFLQGIGIGGEMPVAAVYINELSKAEGRGRFVLVYELVFPLGLLMAGQVGAWVVPAFGWQLMFLLGGVPGLAVAWLVLRLPESPRWLIARQRIDEATAIIGDIEAGASGPRAPRRASTPPARLASPDLELPPPRWRDLLSSSYRSRTLAVWTLWALAGFFTNGLVNWMPTIYSSIYNLPLSQSLRAGALNNVAQIAILILCALTIDRIGRRRWTMSCLVIGGSLSMLLALMAAPTVAVVIGLVTIAYGLISSVNAILYLYTPEIYPTRMRARATGSATCWVRIGSAAGQLLVGYIVAARGPSAVFLMFAAVALTAAIAAAFMIETSNRRLEEIAK
jgi:MFS transporter, putative metabolite:H+ symporter